MSTTEVRIVSTPEGGWKVALGDMSLAGFYGPKARLLAESHRELLIAALGREPRDNGMVQRRNLRLAV
jgi:hypothetical protein